MLDVSRGRGLRSVLQRLRVPEDIAKARVSPVLLQFQRGSGGPAPTLERDFQIQQAIRMRFLLRASTILFIIAQAFFILYDYTRFFVDDSDRSRFYYVLALRCGLYIPLSAVITVATYWRHLYIWRSQYLAGPATLLGGGIITYTIIGGDPGFGVLAMFIVYLSSFTPIIFLASVVVNALLIVAFVVVLLLTYEDVPLSDKLEDFGILAMFFVSISYISHQRESYTRKNLLQEKILIFRQACLEKEQERNDALLRSMLPQQVIEGLKDGTAELAESYDVVTVLFCEICNFSDIAGRLEPHDTVRLLNVVFSSFDALVAEHGVHKVETVGEVFLCVAGAPSRCTNHAALCANMALGMIEAMEGIRTRLRAETIIGNDIDLNIHVGLNSGPVVAGVVGTLNPRWKLFGDTVNTASRMESTCPKGMIQLSPSTTELLFSDYMLERRGEIQVKGKGAVITHLLVGRKIGTECVVSPCMAQLRSAAARESQAAKGAAPRSFGSGHVSGPPAKTGDADAGRGDGPAGDKTPSPPAPKAVLPKQPSGKQGRVVLDPIVTPSQSHNGESKQESTSGAGDGEQADAAAAALRAFGGRGRLRRSSSQGATPSPAARARWKALKKATATGRTTLNAIDALTRGGILSKPANGQQTGNATSQSFALPNDLLARRVFAAQRISSSIEQFAKEHEHRTIAGSFTGSFMANEAAISRALADKPPPASPADRETSSNVSPLKVQSPSTSSKRSPKVARPALPPLETGKAKGQQRAASQRRRARARESVSAMVAVEGGADPMMGVFDSAVQQPPSLTSTRALLFPIDDDFERAVHEANKDTWLRFAQYSAGLCFLAIGVFVLWDAFVSDRPADVLRALAIIRGGFILPVLLLFFASSFTQWGKEHVAALACLSVFLVGCGVIATSVAGKTPGYGVLALYIVYCYNLHIIPGGFRLACFLLLIAGHLIFTKALVQAHTWSKTLEQMAFLIVFYVGQAFPVFAREHQSRVNFFRQQVLREQHEVLAVEEARTVQLLNNLLPASVASRLKSGVTMVADAFPRVSVIFTDMKQFTSFSSKVTPGEVVEFLSAMYSEFDKIAKRYKLYKIELIGDAYYAVCGAPDFVENHAQRMVHAALDMQLLMPMLRDMTGSHIQLRIGIHTGPVVAGVVGRLDPRYHLFGSTVVEANKMESHGVEDAVHISAETYADVEQCGDFTFECRGSIPISGLGDRTTYIVSRVKNSIVTTPPSPTEASTTSSPRVS